MNRVGLPYLLISAFRDDSPGCVDGRSAERDHFDRLRVRYNRESSWQCSFSGSGLGEVPRICRSSPWTPLGLIPVLYSSKEECLNLWMT